MDYSVKKRELLDILGAHLEKRMQIAPLAARIQALMILSPDRGNSFDEIVAFTEASKSSVSSNLNLLLQLKNIEYYNIPGNRKRYFRSSQDRLCVKLIEYLEEIEEEIGVIQRVNAFNEKHNKITYEKQQSTGRIYQEFLEGQKDIIQTTIDKMRKNLRINQ